jgi:hypothetical protein
MNDTLTLDQLQIKRRELENELTTLLQKEQDLESNLKAREKAVIEELQFIISDKKTIIETLESRNTNLNKKLNRLKKKPTKQQTKTNTNNEHEDDVQFTVIEQAPRQTNEKNRRINQKKEKRVLF